LIQAFHTQLQWVLVVQGQLLQTVQIHLLLVLPQLVVVGAVMETHLPVKLVLVVVLAVAVDMQTKVQEQEP
jgi:hypothetical protein